MSLIASRARWAAFSAALAAAALLAPATAGAQDNAATPTLTPKAECVSQFDRAQSMQTARKLQ
ncbi:hypothetical protein BH11MYX4_BH11MYX4_41580 [soil metagenome]